MSHTTSRFTKSAFARKALTTVATAGVAVGLAGLTAGSASANFTLSSGNLSIDAATGSTVLNPQPTSGSWVRLAEDANPANFFNNAYSGTATGEYTSITGADGIELGTYQDDYVNDEIFDRSVTLFGYPDPSGPIPFSFDLKSVADDPATGAVESYPAPELEFSGSASGAGTRSLVSADLRSFLIDYPAPGGWTFNVGTRTGSADAKYLVPVTGSITGNATVAGASYELHWQTDITEAGAFQPFNAEFALEGTYTP